MDSLSLTLSLDASQKGRTFRTPGTSSNYSYTNGHTSCEPKSKSDGQSQHEDQNVNSGSEAYSPDSKLRLIRTGCILLAFMAHGMYGAVCTTSAVDLQELYAAPVDDVTLALGMSMLGQMCGSIFAGALIRRLRHRADIIIGIFTLLEGLTFAFVPAAPNLVVAGVLVCARGIIHGLNFPMAGIVLLAEWGEKAPTTVNLVHMGFSVGSLIGPLITAPFLSSNTYPPGGATTNGSVSNLAGSQHVHDIQYSFDVVKNGTTNESMVIIPFMISGAVGLASGLIFLTLVAIKRIPNRRDTLSPTRATSARETSTRERKFRAVILVMIFLIYLTVPLKDSTVPTFIFYIGVQSPLHIPKSRAAILNTVGAACWVVGRFLAALFTKKLRIHWVMFGVVTIALILSAFLSVFGMRTEINLWILSGLFQMFCAPSHACIMTWLDRYTPVDGTMMSLIEFAASVGGFLDIVIGGFLLENVAFSYLFYFTSLFAVVVLVLLVMLQVIVVKLGDRFAQRCEILVIEESGVTEETAPLLK